ncbi:hypothetical protein HC891_05130 [Candidatus Gracilibacteria bacterium]|nr:hypothetical protein [Candidatus Gracilibacteria bacterium]
MDQEHLIAHIHDAPERLVFAFAGAGSLALWQLHRVAGSSRTILEARDCYAVSALSNWLGFTPTQAVSIETAVAMAQQAYRHAQTLAATGPLLGIACTAAVATDRERRGAERAVVAIADCDALCTYDLMMTKGIRNRNEEEHLIAELLIAAIARACGIDVALPTVREDEMIRQQ